MGVRAGRNLMKKTALGTVVVAVMLSVGGTVGSEPESTAQQQEKEWFAQAQEAVVFGRYDEAIRCFEKVLSINPGFVDVYRFMGDVYMKKGMPDNAIEAYKKALDAKPQIVPALIGLGNAYYQKDMIDKSLASYKRALAIQPKSAPARVGLGNIYYYLKNDPAQALSEYEKGLALEADHAEAQLNAGMILQKNAEQNKAAHHFYKAGLLFIQAGDSKNALKAYEYLRQTEEERLIQLLRDALQPSIKSSESH
jgi:tetratricopeptide (TPR) repeat protein